jgi:hypothetical protein
MQGLGQNKTVKKNRGNMIGVRQISYDSCDRVPALDMQHIPYMHTIPTELTCISIVSNFQNAAADIALVCEEKLLNVIAVNGQSSVKAEFSTDRL